MLLEKPQHFHHLLLEGCSLAVHRPIRFQIGSSGICSVCSEFLSMSNMFSYVLHTSMFPAIPVSCTDICLLLLSEGPMTVFK